VTDNENKGIKSELPRVYSLIRIIRFCFLILIVVLLLWAVYHFREELNIDNLVRFVSYLESGAEGENEAQFRFNSNPLNRFSAFKSGFAVLSPDGVTYLNPVGKEELSVKAAFSNPALQVNDKRMLAFDIGGKSLLLTSDYSVVLNRTTESAIINARLNERNWFTLVTNDKGYKSGLTVCNDHGDEVFRWQTSESYITDADVAPDCRNLVATSFKYSEGEIVSKLVCYGFDSKEPLWQADLGGEYAVAVNFLDNDRICVLTDSGLVFVNAKGETTSRYDFGGMTLKAFSDKGNGFIAMMFTRNRVGSMNLIVNLDYSGEAIAQLETDEAISKLAANGETVATLSPGGITVYTKEFKQKGSYPQYSACRDLALAPDGGVFGILSNSAFKIKE